MALNSRETIELVKFAVGLWHDACDEGGLAWDDTKSNRAFLSGGICATNNRASISIEAKRKPDTYLTEKGEPMWKDIRHARIPKGPSGQFKPSSVHRHDHGLFEEPESRPRLPALGPLRAGIRRMVCLAAGLLGRRCGKRTKCGTPIRCSCRSAISRD